MCVVRISSRLNFLDAWLILLLSFLPFQSYLRYCLRSFVAPSTDRLWKLQGEALFQCASLLKFSLPRCHVLINFRSTSVDWFQIRSTSVDWFHDCPLVLPTAFVVRRRCLNAFIKLNARTAVRDTSAYYGTPPEFRRWCVEAVESAVALSFAALCC